jgi:hypothetical protein
MGRLVLIKTCLSRISVYLLSFIKFPKSAIEHRENNLFDSRNNKVYLFDTQTQNLSHMSIFFLKVHMSIFGYLHDTTVTSISLFATAVRGSQAAHASVSLLPHIRE